MSSIPPKLGPWPDEDEPSTPPPSSSMEAVMGVVAGLGFTLAEVVAASFLGFARGGGYSTYATVVIAAIALISGLLICRRRRELANGFFVGALIGLVGLHPCLVNLTSKDWKL